MYSNNNIQKNYTLYNANTNQTNPQKKTKAEDMNEWSNSSSNYQNYINGNNVEDFQMFDYNSLGNNRTERVNGYKEELNNISQDYISIYDNDGNGKLNFDEFLNMQTSSYEEMFGEELDLENEDIINLMADQFGQLSTINPDERYIDESVMRSLLGVGDNVNIDSYMEKYDSDGDGKLTFEDYQKFHEDQSEEILGYKTDWDTPGLLESVKANFNQVSKINISANEIDSKEFATFLGVADGNDGLNDGTISYENFNSVPELNEYDTALENYYNNLFENTSTQSQSAKEMDEWANSASNYQSYINGNNVEDFQMFDYNSLGDNKADRINGYKQEIENVAQEYISQYDADGDSKLSFSEFANMQAESYKEQFGEELSFNDAEVLDTLSEQFQQLNTLNSDSNHIDSKEFAAFLGVADGNDGLNDGTISYENFNSVPGLNGYESALKNYYNDFFNN